MRRAVLAAVIASLSLLVLAAGAGAGEARHAKSQAELNLLRATGVLARWNVGLVDRRTRLLKSNTVAVCVGRGRPVRSRYVGFTCELRNRGVVVRAGYSAYARGFSVKKLSVVRR